MDQDQLSQELRFIQDKYQMNEKKVKVALKVADSLHQKCIQEMYDVPKPVEWFLNEDKYRNKWLETENWFKDLPNDKFKDVFYHHDSYKLYMKFMHEQFKSTA